MKSIKPLILLVLIVISCKNTSLYNSDSEKQSALRSINTYMTLDDAKYEFIKQHDSISFDLSKSVEAKASAKRMHRRLDSLISKNYTTKMFLIASRFDRELPDMSPIEYDRNGEIKNPMQVKNIEEAIELMKALDSSFSSMTTIKMKDSIFIKTTKE